MALGKAGAKNAGIYSAEILSIYDGKLNKQLNKFKKSLAEEVSAKDRAIAEKLK
jgi:phosphoribosylcarboxyaminoimidazole (NCAIR) mutase